MSTGTNLKTLLDSLNASPSSQRQIEQCTLQVVVFQPGSIGGIPSVGIDSTQFGFDWDANKFLLYPSQPLTTLTPKDVKAIHASAKEGQSWHAYQAYKKQADRIRELEAQVAAMKANQSS